MRVRVGPVRLAGFSYPGGGGWGASSSSFSARRLRREPAGSWTPRLGSGGCSPAGRAGRLLGVGMAGRAGIGLGGRAGLHGATHTHTKKKKIHIHTHTKYTHIHKIHTHKDFYVMLGWTLRRCCAPRAGCRACGWKLGSPDFSTPALPFAPSQQQFSPRLGP